MSAISGACGASLASQLYQRGIEQHMARRIEQQRELQQRRMDDADTPQAGEAPDPGGRHHDNSSMDALKGGLLDTYALSLSIRRPQLDSENNAGA